MFRTEFYEEQIHSNELNKWVNYWNKKNYKNNDTIEKFKIDRLVLPLVTFYKDELFIFSGLEDISSWIPNTWRIMTRCVRTNVKPSLKDFSLRGPGIENKTYPPKLQASIQSCVGDVLRPNYQQIISTNIDTGLDSSQKMGLHMKKLGSKLYDYTNITEKEIWYTRQTIFKVNVDYLISLGENYYGYEKFYELVNHFLKKTINSNINN